MWFLKYLGSCNTCDDDDGDGRTLWRHNQIYIRPPFHLLFKFKLWTSEGLWISYLEQSTEEHWYWNLNSIWNFENVSREYITYSKLAMNIEYSLVSKQFLQCDSVRTFWSWNSEQARIVNIQSGIVCKGPLLDIYIEPMSRIYQSLAFSLLI